MSRTDVGTLHDGPAPLDAPATVRLVDDGSPFHEGVAAAVTRHDGVELETAASTAVGLADLEPVDCVAVGAPADRDPLACVADVRERAPALPVLLVAADPEPRVVDELLAAGGTDLLRPIDGRSTGDLFVRRVRLLVDRQRAAALARRSVAALDSCRQGIAVTDPAGVVQFANRLFAHHLGRPEADLTGRPWRDLFTDDSVARVEADALPCVAEGWRWVGSCVARRPDATTVTVPTEITRLDDGSIAFALPERPTDRGA